MRILIDPQGALSLSRSRGIGRYTRALIRGLVENRGEHEIIILLNMLFPNEVRAFKKEFKGLIPHNNFIPFWGVGESSELNPANEWNNSISEMMLEKMIDDINPDFLLVTSLFEGAMDNSITSIGHYYNKIPTAVIFYDLIPFIHPQKYLDNPMMNRWYRNKIESLKRADILLSISNSAREEALTHLNFDSQRVINISTANDSVFSSIVASVDVEKKYNITRAFLMHTSAFEERKNFIGLIYAFAFLADDIRLSHQLVLVCGLKKHQRKSIEDTISALGLGKDEVILTGFAPDEDLIALYNSCYLFVFPSFHEGFGLPVLEAMSCGAAVIGSNNSSIPEVIGRDDAVFNPYSTCSMAKKITEVLTNKDFHQELKEHSLVQAKQFDWNLTAICAIEAIESSVITKNTKESLSLIELIKGSDIKRDNSDLLKTSIAMERNKISIDIYRFQDNRDYKPKWRVEGPFDSSYSLALLNRETALALKALGHEVALHSTEGDGDFNPNPNFLEDNPKIKELYNNSLIMPQEVVAVTSRNLYPPRVSDMNSPINMLHHYAWEESGFPREWVDDFNNSLDSMTCLSTHVQKIMIDSGVKVPMVTSGCGVDHWERIIADKSYSVEAKEFKFLHVSSCFPRKGADILLKAYGDAFNSSDNVSLIIKTFANPHNEIHKWLQDAQELKKDFPDVIIIEDDLTHEQLKALYESSDTLVGPSRAEGFGLPFAEAMLSGLPVITTGWGGQLDFCSSDTAWIIDYKFTPAKTHFKLFDSVWAEPSVTHLATLMREVYALSPQERAKKPQRGREKLLRDFTWSKVAQRMVDASKNCQLVDKVKEFKLGWITTWNTKCGIATYSEHLIKNIPQQVEILASYSNELLDKDDSNVHRCWDIGDGNRLEDLKNTIDKLDLDSLVIQFNYNFFDFKYFRDFLEYQIKMGRTIVLMLHSTMDADITPHKKLKMLTNVMSRVDRLLVHSYNDLNRLKSYGLVENTLLFPHGILDWSSDKKRVSTDRFTLGSYGFFLPHKGLLELIESVKILKDRGINIGLRMMNSKYPVAISKELIDSAIEKIELLNLSDIVELNTEFLPDSQSLMNLSECDLIVFPTQDTGESASGSVRYGLASNVPVAVTPLAIFDDVNSASYKLSGTTPLMMADSIEEIINNIKNNTSKAQKQKEDARRWCDEHKYTTVGDRLLNILSSININNA